MAKIKFDKVNKIYSNKVQAVFDFSLDVDDKEFIVFVGPSGCGKSTTLRMLAGLEDITSGEIYIDGDIINNELPKDRNIAMVFQNYALYPHMSVYDNMAMSLKLKKVPKTEIEQKVLEAAKILGLEEYLKRKPAELSGGQRQRVALGRAIVRNPKVFLMDEPLSNLDAKLRVQMRSEIAKIHKRVGATTIYVTHDQTEAMTMASRIVVMRNGYIQQIGTPKEVYNYPENTFVGGFIGSPAMNFINGKIIDNKFIYDENNNLGVNLNKDILTKVNEYEGKEIILGIRPEDIHINDLISNKYNSKINIVSDVVELLGHKLIIYGYLNNQQIIMKTSSINEINENENLELTLDLSKVHFFDPITTNRI